MFIYLQFHYFFHLKKPNHLARFHTAQEAVGETIILAQWYTSLILRWLGSKVYVSWLSTYTNWRREN